MTLTIFIPKWILIFTKYLSISILLVLACILLLFILSFLPRLILRHFQIWKIMWVNWTIHKDKGVLEYGIAEISELLEACLSDKPDLAYIFERVIKEHKK